MPKPRKPGSHIARTTIEFPVAMWRKAKIRAMDERTDFRAIVLKALRAYLTTPIKGGRR
jgi:hypothetical protein